MEINFSEPRIPMCIWPIDRSEQFNARQNNIFTISDSKWYWNHTGYRAVDAVCLLQKRIERGSQAAIASHTYMSTPKYKVR